METKICIYCGRTLDLSMLSEKAGTYRCKDENDCLAYQTGEEADDSIDHPDNISDLVKASLSDAAEFVLLLLQNEESSDHRSYRRGFNKDGRGNNRREFA